MYDPALGRWLSPDPLGIIPAHDDLFRDDELYSPAPQSESDYTYDTQVDYYPQEAQGGYSTFGSEQPDIGDSSLYRYVHYSPSNEVNSGYDGFAGHSPFDSDRLAVDRSNLYRYVYNSPTNAVDPSGEVPAAFLFFLAPFPFFAPGCSTPASPPIVRVMGGNFHARLSFSGFDNGQIDKLQKAFDSAADQIDWSWRVLRVDSKWTAYQDAGKNSAVAKWLAEGDRRATWTELLSNVNNKLNDPNYTIYLKWDPKQPENGRQAAVFFDLWNNPSKDITIYPQFFKQPPGMVIYHELGRYINAMHLDGGPPPGGQDSRYNVDAWDAVIGSILGNYPPKS